ncbi:hypothetical protein [Nocardioides sp. Soil805]|uniref:hypothetical protein n=1 Tax=Nocardioides sp. Soil805 TaxID=1736416 RepID=UPI000702A0CA|nr:hypothetical protein [Nocardioides sp. Soil805]KRF37425.1 hypothetical protein ASG94_08880 [Nocardioides sp. Soil805]
MARSRRSLTRQGWTASLFVVGSTCFLLGPLPGFVDLVGTRVDALVFFVGSLFFTSAATLEWTLTRATSRRAPELWSSGVQLAGTVFFNVSTFRALSTTWGDADYDDVVWRPDAFGSVCFLVSGLLAYAVVAGRLLALPPATTDGTMAALNLLGCLAFGAAALGSYVVAGSDTAVRVGVANAGTSLGALAFLAAAVLLLRDDLTRAG